MAFQSLYRRYRPRRFSEVKGQDHVVRALRNAVREGTVAHAYLFSGPRGTGKTSTARLLAKALNCDAPVDGEPCAECPSCLSVEAGTSLDVSELDAASNNGVEAMRDLIRRVALVSGGRHRVYILDEVHMLSTGAENALLKTLEEPPANVAFVLATTDPQKVAPTIRSRTQHFDFRLLPAATLAEHLTWVAADAGLELAEGAVDAAVRRGQGSARDSLSALDQIVAGGGAAEEDSFVDELVEALCERDTGRALLAVAGACSAGRDPRQLGESLLGYLRDAFLTTMAPDAVSLPDTMLERVSDQGRRLGPAAAVRGLDAVGEALLAMREAPDPRVALEVALVRVTRPEVDPSPGAVLERVERLERAMRGGAVSTPAPAAAAGEGASDATAPVPADLPPLPAAGVADGRAAARQAMDAATTREPGPASPPAARPALGGVRRQSGAPSSSSSAPAPSAATAPASSPPAAPEPEPEPPVVQAATAGADAGSGGPLPSREQVTLAWPDHVAPKLNVRARGLYNSGRFTAVDDGTVVFAVTSEIMVRKAEEHRTALEGALAEHFGRPLPVRIVVDDDVAPDDDPARGAGGQRPSDDDEPVDVTDLTDAPAATTGLDRLTDAFPGAEVLDP